jgi:hypothetical protein
MYQVVKSFAGDASYAARIVRIGRIILPLFCEFRTFFDLILGRDELHPRPKLGYDK